MALNKNPLDSQGRGKNSRFSKVLSCSATPKRPNEHLILIIEEEGVKLEFCEKETKLVRVSWP